ncbi:MAG TPA: hypothetical protein ACFCUD_11210 [Cyclobacteriaceae bacterium]
MTDLQLASQLLIIGMITVFMVLLTVFFTGNLIINVVNKYWPDESKEALIEEKMSSKKIAAIFAAVESVTQGQGRITKIEKINNP